MEEVLLINQNATIDESNMDYIVDMVIEGTGVSKNDLKAKTRLRKVVMLRHIAMFFIRINYPLISLKSIGNHFGGRDHATVIHGIDVVRDLYSVDKVYRANLNRFCIEINPLIINKLD